MNPKILLHVCCAPCAIVPFQELSKHFDIHLLWYNPNIQPVEEYIKRVDALKKFKNYYQAKIIFKLDYSLEKFFQQIVYRENKRCHYCYYDRLKTTFNIAKNGNFDFFSTTLLQSHQQDRDFIVESANNITKESHTQFLYFDYLDQWKEGVKRSKELNFYRQQYCGCIFSEFMRYKNELKKLAEE